jgi:hypothetical protein
MTEFGGAATFPFQGPPPVDFAASVQQTEVQALVEIQFDEYGSVPDHVLLPDLGISSEEGRQLVTYKGHTDTLAKALLDSACPLGDKFREAHAQDKARGDGRSDAVEAKAAAFNEFMGTNIKVAPKPPEQHRAAHVARINAESPKKKLM